MVVLACQEKKMDTAVIFVVSPLNARLNALFKTQLGTGMFKRIIDQFSFSGKSRKKAFS